MAKKVTVKPWDRKPTPSESLDSTIKCMIGSWTLTSVLEQLERDASHPVYWPEKVTLLRKRLERGGPIVKPRALLSFKDYFAWVEALKVETEAPGRRSQIALLTAMELPHDTAMRVAVFLRFILHASGLVPPRHQTFEGMKADSARWDREVAAQQRRRLAEKRSKVAAQQRAA